MLRLWVQWWQWMMITSCIYSNKMQSIALFLFHFFPSVLLITLSSFAVPFWSCYCSLCWPCYRPSWLLCSAKVSPAFRWWTETPFNFGDHFKCSSPFSRSIWVRLILLFFLAVLEYLVTVISCFHALRIGSFWKPFCCSNQAGPSCPRPISGGCSPC